MKNQVTLKNNYFGILVTSLSCPIKIDLENTLLFS
jgi:hypothetical protein